MSWVKIRKSVGENRFYLLMLVFIVATEIFLAQSPLREKKEKLAEKKKSHRILAPDEIAAQEERIKEMLSRNSHLAVAVTASTFASALALMAGLVIGINCIARRLNGREIMAGYGSPPDVCWRLTDILRIIVIFYFFGYLLQWTEAGIADLINLKKPVDGLFTILNATAMDFIGIALVLYFAVNKFKSGLAGLGLISKNVRRDIGVAIAGYLAIIPVLAIIMVVVLIGLKVFNYEPPETKALEILYEAKGPRILFILTALVTLIGPVAEELFFRGFAYPIFRKRIGVRNAILLVSGVFAVMHMNIVSFFPILVLGILLAYLYEKTGSIIPSITVHVIHNAAVVFFVFLYKLIALPR